MYIACPLEPKEIPNGKANHSFHAKGPGIAATFAAGVIYLAGDFERKYHDLITKI